MMETMIPPQVGMRLRTLQKEKKEKRERPKRKKRPKKKKKKKKGQMRKRERPKKGRPKKKKGQCYYPFSILVLQSSTMIFMIESLLFCHFHILVGIFHYRTWLVYSNNGLPQMP